MVPLTKEGRFWRDADDSQLISYVDLNYGNFSARNYDIAVTKVVDDRSYHPVREFLNSLPEWDKIPRVDTLLVDFLGAGANVYVRAVTRKTLCGAIARVMSPGCKFDTMLVLNGPQGKGKSTLIAKLSGEWFNDSLLLNDTRDKTAAEKLQGYWILEIGELAGLKKTEIETLRGLINSGYRNGFRQFDFLLGRYKQIKEEMDFLEYAIRQLSGRRPEIIWDMIIKQASWQELMIKYNVSHAMVGKYRKKAVEELKRIYELRGQQTDSYLLS